MDTMYTNRKNIKLNTIKALFGIIIFALGCLNTIEAKAAPKTYTTLPDGYEYVTDWTNKIEVGTDPNALPSSMVDGKEYVISRTSTVSHPFVWTAYSKYVVDNSVCPICNQTMKRSITGTWNGQTVKVYAHHDYPTNNEIQIILYQEVKDNKLTGNFSRWDRCELRTDGQQDLHTYYIQYREIRSKGYTVNFNPGSYSSGTVQSLACNLNTSYSTKGAIFSRAGYTQTGWSKNSNGSTLDYNLNTSYVFSTTAGSTVNLYPYWTVNKYMIDINGEIDGTNTTYITDIGTVDITVNNSLKANDVGDHYDKYDYNSSYSIGDIKAKQGYTYVGLATGSDALSGTLTKDMYIRLKFTTNSYTVTLKAGTGIKSVSFTDNTATSTSRKYKVSAQ